MTASPPSFSDWYKSAYPRVAAALMTLTGDRWLAREAADEAFVRAWQHWGRVAQMESPSGWTIIVGRNFVRSRIRRLLVEQRLLGHVPDSCADRPEGWDVELVESIERLPRRQRLAVALHYAADLSIGETAAAMGVSQGTVASTLHTARENLSKRLRDSELAKEMQQ
jgi:RNA polymerase sigma-70 factor (ECF subfamily)